MDSVVKNLRCASLRCALQRCVTQNWLEIAVPSPFFKKVIGTAISGLSIRSCWVYMLNLLAFLAPKGLKLQKC